MSDRYSSPERVKRVSQTDILNLITTASTLEEHNLDVPPSLAKERDALQKHAVAVTQFGDRMRFGSAVSGHTEDVIDFLIDQGWTPPPGKFLLNDPEEKTS